MKHPYENVPDAARWSRAVAGRADDDIDPVAGTEARIGLEDRVVSAGSCFAQNVVRYLEAYGHECFRTETAHPLLGTELARHFQYGLYSARYGNIYTTRQLLQLWRRATGRFVPKEQYWEDDGAFYDPFRSTVHPGGFRTLRELEVDRAQHLAAVRDTFTRMNVFIFTLGLTECWTSAEDGAVFPLCPGVVVGTFDPERHVKRNFTADEVRADLEAFIEEVREVNPTLRVILTISPQAQMVTTAGRHVLVEMGYSKARLRVAAERVCEELPEVHYFPSYELAMVPGTGYFADDRRTILESGVARVMKLFLQHIVEGERQAPSSAEAGQDAFLADGDRLLRVICDEDLLDGTVERLQEPIPDTQPGTWSPLTIGPYEQKRMEARALAVEGKVAEALAIVEALYEEEPRAGIALLIEKWRARL